MRIVLSMLALGLAAGCNGMQAPGQQPPAMPSAAEREAAAGAALRAAQEGVVYRSADANGTQVSLRQGETLRIELGTIPTAGYVWQVVSAPSFLELTGEQTRPTDPAVQDMAGFTGGNHYMSFDFLALSAGSGEIMMVEGRPWETDEAPMDTYTLTVSVAEAQ